MTISGTSARENLADVRRFVEDLISQKRATKGVWSNWVPIVIDVGAGQGTYADALDGLGVVLEAVEVWGPSVERLRGDPRYRVVYNQDIREAGGRGLYQGASVVIFGDVLEHMSVFDAVMTFGTALQWADDVIVSVPNSPYPQGAIDGNHLEEHIILDPVRELIPILPPPTATYEYAVTNMYIWKRGS